MGPRTALVVAACLVCVATVLAAHAHDAVDGHPEPVAQPTQVSFDPVSRVPHCADFAGTGPLPPEGHAALFVQPPDASTMYFAAELSFDTAGWVADDVVLGDESDVRHFTLYVYAVPARFLEWLTRLPPHYAINRLPTRLLDSLIAIRTNTPDTC